MDNISVFDFIGPVHTEHASLAVPMESLNVVQVQLGLGSCLGCIKQNWHDDGHVQLYILNSQKVWLA